MYEIQKDGQRVALAEKVNFVRWNDRGFFVLCGEDEAQGVAISGGVSPILGRGGEIAGEPVTVLHFDGGVIIQETAYETEKANAIIDYNVMMGNIEDPEVDANAQSEL